MNENTKEFLDMCDDIKNYYTVNKDSIHPSKSIATVLPLLNEMIEMYNREFENSIAYLELHEEEQVKKRQVLVEACTYIYEAIRQYSAEQNNTLFMEFSNYSEAALRQCTDDELNEKLQTFTDMVKPITGLLMPYGVTNARLKALSFHLSNFLPALPVHVSEIDERKKGYQSAISCLASIEAYLTL